MSPNPTRPGNNRGTAGETGASPKANGQTSARAVNLDELLEKRIEEARRKKEWRTFIIQTICFVLAVYLLLTLFIGIGIVHGDSMEPNVHNGDIYLIWRLSGGYEYGDVLFFESAGAGELLVKRVIGVPGDTVELSGDGQVIVNNVILFEPFVYSETYARDGNIEYPLTLGKDEYFVLGDNRGVSIDSRDSRVGVIKKSDIKGKIIFLFRIGNNE